MSGGPMSGGAERGGGGGAGRMSGGPEPGRGIVRAAGLGTGLFVLVSIAGVLRPSLGTPVLLADATLAGAGCVAFFMGYWRALRRSRFDVIGIASLFFLGAEVAPAPVRRSLLGCLLVAVVVALVAASVRPYSDLAAGVLVPIYPVGFIGLWAARHGKFPPRVEK